MEMSEMASMRNVIVNGLTLQWTLIAYTGHWD
jgi:hypothetical protein